MGAPSTAYTGDLLPVHIPGVVRYDSNLALKLLEYGNNIKTLFYLDLLLVPESSTQLGFLGAIEDNPANFNYQFHNPARYSKLRLKGPDNKVYIVLNDGGLNTLGEIVSFSLSSFLSAGGVTFNSVYKSAYYDASTISIRFRKNGESSWANTVQFRGTAEKELFTEVDRFWNLEDSYPDIAAGDLFDIQLFLTNPEGIFYSSIETVEIEPYLIQMRTGSTPANAYNNSTLTDVYPSTRTIDIGTILYEVWHDQLPYNGGYFMEENTGLWYLINTNGVVTDKGVYSPVVEVSYSGSSARLGTGTKFGDYISELTISNTNASPVTTDSCVITIGKLNSEPVTLGNLGEVLAQDTFDSISVNGGSSSYRSASGFIEDPYAGSTWVWILTKSGTQIAYGYL